MLKAECGIAQSSTNVAEDVALNLMLASRQEMLAMKFDWPFLEQRWEAAVAASAQFVAEPTTTVAVNGVTETASINWDRPVCVATRYTNQWFPVDYGIGNDEYDAVPDPCDPVRRWRHAANVNEPGGVASMIEVWPTPLTATTLRFNGRRKLYDLFPPSAATAYLSNTAAYSGDLNARTYLDALTADLDDLLLIHTCAAERLAKLDQHNAQVQAGLARERWLVLTATSASNEDPIIYGSSHLDRPQKRLVPMTIIHG